jgi:SAM-dependent methyltransferase
MSAARQKLSARRPPVPRVCAEVVWHDLECGSYGADLALWRELAERSPGPVLDIGAGSGRVALELARAGHEVTALERDRVLLDALRARSGGARVQCVCADARSFTSPARGFALCLVPMQTLQLLGGRAGRTAFLSRARAALRPGGLLACAILGEVDPFEIAAGERGPEPETALIDGALYSSQPTRVAVRRRSVVIERERRIFAATASGPPGVRDAAAARLLHRESSVIELDRVSPRTLRREALAAGLRAEPAREVPPTDDHAGSSVVMLRG